MLPLEKAFTRLTRAVNTLESTVSHGHGQKMADLNTQVATLADECTALKRQLQAKYTANQQVQNQVDTTITRLETLLKNHK